MRIAIIVGIVLALGAAAFWYARRKGWLAAFGGPTTSTLIDRLPPEVSSRIRGQLGPYLQSNAAAPYQTRLMGPSSQAPFGNLSGFSGGRESITGRPGDPLPNATIIAN